MQRHITFEEEQIFQKSIAKLVAVASVSFICICTVFSPLLARAHTENAMVVNQFHQLSIKDEDINDTIHVEVVEYQPAGINQIKIADSRQENLVPIRDKTVCYRQNATYSQEKIMLTLYSMLIAAIGVLGLISILAYWWKKDNEK
ncbi:hypothetical protein [Streptococcus ovis]|uniref:hypothetical protein n=1 Tax=Streptococcus ovis TaxID=82806 RepID=UPI0012EAD928|nr:hypothetical protein [Streptococcus ovis]